jgi:hypothetical protein
MRITSRDFATAFLSAGLIFSDIAYGQSQTAEPAAKQTSLPPLPNCHPHDVDIAKRAGALLERAGEIANRKINVTGINPVNEAYNITEVEQGPIAVTDSIFKDLDALGSDNQALIKEIVDKARESGCSFPRSARIIVKAVERNDETLDTLLQTIATNPGQFYNLDRKIIERAVTRQQEIEQQRSRSHDPFIIPHPRPARPAAISVDYSYTL